MKKYDPQYFYHFHKILEGNIYNDESKNRKKCG